MIYKIDIAQNLTIYEHARLEFESYNNGKKSVFIDIQTADGYSIKDELSDGKIALIISMLLTSITGSTLDRLCEISNKCRSINDNPELVSMLGELESTLTDIAIKSVDCTT